MFIQTEETPNPLTLKFLPGRTVLKEGTLDFPDREAAALSPLALKLFNIPGIQGVFMGADFISITKSEEANWLTLKPSLLTAIMEYFLTHKEVEVPATAGANLDKVAFSEDDIESEIIELLDTRIRPAVAQDGGDIVFEKFEDGVVYVQLQGACSGCPSSSATLKSGIENMLKHYIPEVKEVRAI